MPQHWPAPSTAELDQIIARHLASEGPMLPILHDIQDSFGHIPEMARPMIADAQNLSGAEVQGVISFYHDFRVTPPGRHRIKICRAEACQSMGADALMADILAHFDLTAPGTQGPEAQGDVTVEPVYCLGLCACAPAAMINGAVLGRATPDAITAKLAAKETGVPQ
jgi:formate dehydrogenase subunit gamma